LYYDSSSIRQVFDACSTAYQRSLGHISDVTRAADPVAEVTLTYLLI